MNSEQFALVAKEETSAESRPRKKRMSVAGSKTKASKVPVDGPTPDVGVRNVFTPADLRPGKLLLLEFSRPGGSKEDEQSIDLIQDVRDREKAKKIRTKIEKNTQKLVNIAYSKMLSHFAHVPWGFFCEDHEVPEIAKVLKQVQEASIVMNRFAIEMKSPRRVRIEVFPVRWDHEDVRIRQRVGEMVAQELLDLRNAYTSSIMWKYRVRIERAQNIDRFLQPGEQADLVRAAIQSTKAQRKVMIAIYGQKCPSNWEDPLTGAVKVKLDFTEIDRAIRCFYPAWEPGEQDGLPF